MQIASAIVKCVCMYLLFFSFNLMKTVYITAPNKIPCNDGGVVEGMVFRELDTLLLRVWTTISYTK